MENFVVSARKYRPTDFEEVLGQEHITTTLKNAIDNNQLAQALLFCGPRGVGKTTCARIVARLINGQSIDNPLLNNDSFNIYELDAASNNSVDDIRSLIEQVRYPPQQGKFKVYIIDEVHMLSNQAFNAFLKTLEEPPSYAIFILATTEKHKVIPTILSRCQIFDFNRIEITDITNQLKIIADKEGTEVEEEALNLIAQKADGAMRDALSLFDLIVTFSKGGKVTYQNTIDNLHILDYDYYFRITDALFEEKTSETLLLFDEILKKGFDGHNFIVGLGSHLRDLMVCKDNATVELLQASDTVKERYTRQANQIPLSFLLTALNIIGHCDLNYKASKNQRLHVELALLKIAHLSAAISLAKEGSASDEASKKKSSVKPETGSESTVTKQPVVQKNEGGAVLVPISEQGVQPSIGSLPPVVSNNQQKTPSKTSAIPSDLNALRKAVNEPKEETQTTTEKTALRNNSYTPGAVQKAWDEFAGKNNLQQLDQEVLKSSYHLEKDTITVSIPNQALMSNFEKLRSSLLAHLRNALDNDQLNMEAKVVEVSQEKMRYTDQEKFNYLKEKYPVLKELQEKLGLEPDF